MSSLVILFHSFDSCRRSFVFVSAQLFAYLFVGLFVYLFVYVFYPFMYGHFFLLGGVREALVGGKLFYVAGFICLVSIVDRP